MSLSNCPFLVLTTTPSSLLCFLSVLLCYTPRKSDNIVDFSAIGSFSSFSMSSKRVYFSPDVNEKPTIFLKNHGSGAARGGRVLRSNKRILGNWTAKIPNDHRLSPVRFLVRFGEKVAKAVGVVSMRRKSSPKVSSTTTVRSVSLSDHTDSHRAEAVEACIEFLHSSSTRERPI